jgi:tetratricopeptide (TPR) repeat protein
LKTAPNNRKKTFRIVIGVVILISLGILGWFQIFVAGPVHRLHQKITDLIDSDPDQALSLYPQLVALIEKQNMWSADKAKALFEWETQLQMHKRQAEALPVLERCLALCRDKPPGTMESRTLLDIANCNLLLGKKVTDEDFKNLAVAAKVHPPIETNIDSSFWPYYEHLLGRMFVMKGAYADAIKHLQKSVDGNKGYDFSYQEAQSFMLDAFLRQGKYKEANQKFVEYFGAIPKENNRVFLPNMYWKNLERVEDKDPEFKPNLIELLSKKQFAALDELAAKLLAAKEIEANGDIAINRFNEAIDSLEDRELDSVWKERISLLEEWIKMSPASATAKISLGKVLISYAWKARGSDVASEVTESDWKKFGERLDQAKAILDQAKDRPPHWYSVMQQCALGQNWETGPYDALVVEGQKRYPNYDRVLFNKCYRLLPRWGGKPGECESYITAEANKRPGIAGDIFYARSLWYLNDSIHENMIAQTKLSWPRIKNGMQAIVKQYPHALSAKGALSAFAMEENDKETALKAFDK